MKDPFTFYDKEKSLRKTQGKQANSKGLISRTFLHVLWPGGGLFQQIPEENDGIVSHYAML